MRLTLCALGAALVCVSAASAAHSAPGPASFALVPVRHDPALRATQSYFVALARPGSTFRSGVRVRNTGARTGTVLLSAVDATTGRTSGAVYLDRSRPRHGVGAWMTLGAGSLTLAPGASRVVAIVVHVPPGARPGDHLGGVVAENAALTSAGGKSTLRVRVRHLTIAAVLVQVPGAADARVRIGGVRPEGEHGYQYVSIRLGNIGSSVTKPTGRLLVRTATGRAVTSQQLRLDTFLPGTAIDYPVLLPGQALAPGRYRATVHLSYAAEKLGYRRVPGPVHAADATFAFAVTAGQYRAVFEAAKPLTRQAKHAANGSTLGAVLAGSLAAVAGVSLFLVLGVRRWARH